MENYQFIFEKTAEVRSEEEVLDTLIELLKYEFLLHGSDEVE